MRPKLSRKENRKAWLYAALIVLIMLMIGALAWIITHRETPLIPGSLPPTSQTVLDAANGLDSITIDAAFDPEQKLLTATQVMTLRNRTGVDQSAAVLRSYSGAYLSEETSPAATEELFDSCYGTVFSPGGLLLDSARIDGSPVSFTWADQAKTVLSLPVQWAKDASITVTLAYRVQVPDCASRFGVQNDIFALGNVFPTAAVWDESAWRTDPYISIGDPFLSECANWTVRLTLPKAYAVASTAYAEPVISGDAAVYTLQAQTVRDFALVISSKFKTATAMAGDTMLIACAQSDFAARAMTQYARKALLCYESHYGPYVYPTLTLAEVPFPFGGMEYPRMAMIGTSAIKAPDSTLEYTVAHETAHQWWYGMVGSDAWYHAWQDESLCEYALMDYIGDTYGPEARGNAIFQRIDTALQVTVPRGVTPGSPIDAFGDLPEYTLVTYRRGAAMWLALENYLGKDGLDAALRAYAEQFRFGIATREDISDVLSAAAGHDISALMIDYLDTHMD